MGYPDHQCEWRKLADGLTAALALKRKVES